MKFISNNGVDVIAVVVEYFEQQWFIPKSLYWWIASAEKHFPIFGTNTLLEVGCIQSMHIVYASEGSDSDCINNQSWMQSSDIQASTPIWWIASVEKPLKRFVVNNLFLILCANNVILKKYNNNNNNYHIGF